MIKPEINYVFFTDALGAGGISTNIVALASYVANFGCSPIIIPISSRKFSNSVWAYCQQFANMMPIANLIILTLKGEAKEYIFFVNSIKSLLAAYLILFLLILKKHKIKIVFATYHPSEFSHNGYWASLYRKLVCSLGEANIFFMNGACFSEHQAACNPVKLSANYLPLAIPSFPFEINNLIRTKTKSVLTVGRFVGFKMHYLRSILEYARARPYINFYLVGDGDGENELRGYVGKHAMNNVNFLGAVEYSKLKSLYSNVTCYVGMGTTLIEASSMGTPSIVSIVGLPGNVSYGLFTEQADYDVGEYRSDKPIQVMSTVLDYVLSLDAEVLKDLGHSHVAFTKKFTLEVIGATFITLIKSSTYTRVTCTALLYFISLVLILIPSYGFFKFIGGKSRYDKKYL